MHGLKYSDMSLFALQASIARLAVCPALPVASNKEFGIHGDWLVFCLAAYAQRIAARHALQHTFCPYGTCRNRRRPDEHAGQSS